MWKQPTKAGCALLIALATCSVLTPAASGATLTAAQMASEAAAAQPLAIGPPPAPTKVGLTTINPTPDPAPIPLQLDVKINGFALKLIGAFTQYADGHIESTRSELSDLGIAVPGSGAPEQSISLAAIQGLTYNYDQASQSIDIKLPNQAQIAKDIKGQPARDLPKAQTGTGLVVNYTAYAAADYKQAGNLMGIDGGNLSLDARAYSKWGTLRQSGIIGTTTFSDFTALRLDSTWTYSDQDNMRTYRLGDIISGGLRWTRPIRMGGAQMQRNFRLRPDLITMPLPFVSGSAAVPSTVDVYLGDVKAYSSPVDPGRFNINDLPVFTNAGKARMVLTDASGRQVESETDFQTSPDLLKKNLYDFSADMGVVRRNYGTESDAYDNQPVALGTLRYGLNNSLTGEAHLEAKSDLVDAGIGALVSAGPLGLFNGAVAASKFGDKQGLFFHAGWEKSFSNLSFSASSSRTLGDYYDLAAATEIEPSGLPLTGAVPQALDQISIGYIMPKTQSGIGLNFVHQLKPGTDESFLFSGSFSQQLSHDISLFLNGYIDVGPSGNRGVMLGFSMPLGGGANATTSAVSDSSGLSATADISKPMGEKPGDYGWRVATSQSNTNLSAASASYRTGKGVLSGNVATRGTDAAQANVTYSGAAVLAGGSAFLSDQINDAFAVVDAGKEGVKVDFENRYVGKTGKDGKLLLPGLHSYQKNRIAIDVNDLPLGASVDKAEADVVPADANGVTVNFGVNTNSHAVLVTLTDAQGKFIPEGTEVRLNENPEPLIMGYDGQVYVTGAAAKNVLEVKLAQGSCQVHFDYGSQSASPAGIGPLKCQ